MPGLQSPTLWLFALAAFLAGPILARLYAHFAEAPDHLGLKSAVFASASAAIVAVVVLTQQSTVRSVLAILLGWQLLLIAAVDGRRLWLPDALTLTLLATGVLTTGALTREFPWPALIGAAAGFTGLWLAAIAYKRFRRQDGLGDGDPILFAAGGAWVGWLGLPSVLLWACAVGIGTAVARSVSKREGLGQARLPFGVFLAVGIWMTWLIGPIGMSAGG